MSVDDARSEHILRGADKRLTAYVEAGVYEDRTASLGFKAADHFANTPAKSTVRARLVSGWHDLHFAQKT